MLKSDEGFWQKFLLGEYPLFREGDKWDCSIQSVNAIGYGCLKE